jgi:hypothetical protein
MKNIQFVDGAMNCVYDIFAATRRQAPAQLERAFKRVNKQERRPTF